MNQRTAPCIATELAAAWPPYPEAILLVSSLTFCPQQPVTSVDEDGRAHPAPRCSQQVCYCGVQSCSQQWRQWPGVPRKGDGAAAPQGLAVSLATHLGQELKSLFAFVLPESAK